MSSRVLKKLKACGQEHVLRFYDELDKEGRQQLESQIAELDLDLIARLAEDTAEGPDWADMARRAEQPPAFRLGEEDAPFSPQQARQCGENALAEGKIAALIVAGGQGTRLDFHHPKGMFEIGAVSKRSFFQVFFERVMATARRYGAPVPLFIMTSPATHSETIEFLEEKNFWNMPAENVQVFCQGTMPAIDKVSKKLLLESKSSLALAPDGHGGMLAALSNSGSLRRARELGIEQFSYGQIDNPLAQVCHPELIGYHLLAQSEMTSQVVRKREPKEKVGNVVMVDGKMQIIEYIDLPDEAALEQMPDGSLKIWAGSIAVHVFDVAFLERIADQADALPFHQAEKAVKWIDEQGVAHSDAGVKNAIKFERFIFDLLPAANNPIVVEGDPAEVFAPVKNSEERDDVDTPTTARTIMTRLYTKWLKAAEVEVKDGVTVEISPLWALDARQVAERVELPMTIDQPTYFGETGD